jgi:hypothetical protein
MSLDKRKKDVTLLGMVSSGRTNYLKYLDGNKIGLKGAVLSKCFDCMGYYIDGRNDCGIPECPLYPWMPYGAAVKNARKSSLPPLKGPPTTLKPERGMDTHPPEKKKAIKFTT